jgi:CHAT domain-containing protein
MPKGDLNDYLPDLGDRGDLIEVVRRVRLRHDLEYAISTYIRGIEPLEAKRLQADLTSWDEQLDRFLPGLTAYEVELCCKPSPTVLYRDQCLAAGRNYWVYPLLEEDALPALAEPNKPSVLAPQWIQDEIIDGGARAFRTNVGPHPIWLLTGETSRSQAAIEALSIPGQSYGLGHRVDSGRVEIWFRLPITDGDPGPAQEVPFFYSLSYVNSAWQLLHLAAVGYVRLVILTLAQDDALLTRGSIVINLPREMRDNLNKHALSALRSLVGDDTRAILWRRSVDDPEEISSATFHANEAAKGEELLDEIIREPPPGTGPGLWPAFQEASRALARARARTAAALANGRSEPELVAAAERAVEHRQRVREMARTGSGAFDRQVWERGLAAELPDDRTAFIHFFFKNEILQTIYLTREGDVPAFSSVRSSPVTMEPLLAVVQKWTDKENSSLDWHRTLQTLLAELTQDVLQPLAEELHARGLTRLIISPTPPLDLLPLHAVPVTVDGTRHALCEAFAEITYMPTMRMLAAISDRPMSASNSPLIVAHSGGYPRFPHISGPALEAANLHALYPDARIITEHEATPQTVLAAMTGSRVIHVASHAYPGDRWANGLVIEGEKLSQAILSAADVLADGDLTGVELVVLNACRTGSHRSVARVVQTLRGLEAAFLARGAHTVISTFWEINDLTALVFATLLHASMAQQDAPGEAYRDAIAYMRREGWHEPTCPEGPQHRAETLLDLAKPTWREELDRQIRSNPLSWSSFKITGLP